jgi:hypothetical protein
MMTNFLRVKVKWIRRYAGVLDGKKTIVKLTCVSTRRGEERYITRRQTAHLQKREKRKVEESKTGCGSAVGVSSMTEEVWMVTDFFSEDE